MVANAMHTSTNGVAQPLSNGLVPKAMDVKPLPKGKYTMVGVDIDTTGRRLIDEIVQLAAFTPTENFQQYIMPYMNLNPAARQRHQVRVISIGFYRMLKSMQTYKIIKSKSEIAALKDFLDWIEAVKAKDPNSQGIILVYYEERKFIPYMILESLKKYNLLDRFNETVKSFTNGLNLAKNYDNGALQNFPLRKLTKFLNPKTVEKLNAVNADAAGDNSQSNVVSSTAGATPDAAPQGNCENVSPRSQQEDHDMFEGNASVRAKLAFEVTVQLSSLQCQEPLDSVTAIDKCLTALQPYTHPIGCDINELHSQNEILERQNSFRPVFLNYFKTTIYHRVRAVKFRIILSENGYDLQTLNGIWGDKQKDGIIEVLQIMEELKEDDKLELADLFDSYFDPAKTTIKPIVKSNNNRRRNRRGNQRNNATNTKNDGNNGARPGSEQGAGDDKQQHGAVELPDSTMSSATSPGNEDSINGGKHQRKRQQRSRNNSVPTQNGSNEAVTTGVTANDAAAVSTSAPTAIAAN